MLPSVIGSIALTSGISSAALPARSSFHLLLRNRARYLLDHFHQRYAEPIGFNCAERERNTKCPQLATNACNGSCDGSASLPTRSNNADIGTPRIAVALTRRPVDIRLAPVSYFCTCWNVTPRRSARCVCDSPLAIRQIRTLFPTAMSTASGCLGSRFLRGMRCPRVNPCVLALVDKHVWPNCCAGSNRRLWT